MRDTSRATEEQVVDTVQVLLAVDSPLLAGFLRDLLRRAPDIEVVGEVDDPVDLLLAIAETGAQVVIHSWPNGEDVPPICSVALTEYPDLLFIGLPSDADGMTTCRQTITTTRIPSIGLDDLLGEIRGAFSLIRELSGGRS